MTTLYTIGHGNRSAEELVDLLKEACVKCLVEVRSYPGSRTYPHFSRISPESTLSAQGLHYLWDSEALGGVRKPKAKSRHAALRSDGFAVTPITWKQGGSRPGFAPLLRVLKKAESPSCAPNTYPGAAIVR